MANTDDEDLEQKKPKKGKNKLILLIGILVLLLSSVGGTLFFMGFFEQKEGGDETVEVEVTDAPRIPIYYKFVEPFTVNFDTDTGIRYLQISMEAMSYDQAVIDAMELHMPVIRNNLILMYSSQPFDELISRDGKERIRQAALEEIRSVLKRYGGASALEEVYFTSFVMQ